MFPLRYYMAYFPTLILVLFIFVGCAYNSGGKGWYEVKLPDGRVERIEYDLKQCQMTVWKPTIDASFNILDKYKGEGGFSFSIEETSLLDTLHVDLNKKFEIICKAHFMTKKVDDLTFQCEVSKLVDALDNIRMLKMTLEKIGSDKDAISYKEAVISILKKHNDIVNKDCLSNSKKDYDQDQAVIKRLLKELDTKDVTMEKMEQTILYLTKRFEEAKPLLNMRSKVKENLEAGNLEAAENILKQSFAESSKVAAEDAHLLGFINEVKLDYQTAKKYYEKSILLDSQNADYLNHFGVFLDFLLEHQDAIKYFSKALEINLAVFGEKNAKVATNYNNLGLAWSTLDKNKSIEYLNRALDINREIFGEESIEVAMTYNNLGLVWGNAFVGFDRREDLEKQLDYFTKALNISLLFYSEVHPEIAIIYNNMGTTLGKMGGYENYKKSALYLTKALTANLALYGEENYEVGMNYKNLGVTFYQLRDLENAKLYFEKALRIYTTLFGERHPNVAYVLYDLSFVWFTMKDLPKMTDSCKKAIQILEQYYGGEHNDTKMVKMTCDVMSENLATQLPSHYSPFAEQERRVFLCSLHNTPCTILSRDSSLRSE